MRDEQLNDLLQQWAAVRIKSSSNANRAKRLRDILDGISKKEPRINAKPGSASECLDELYSGPMRKKPRSVTLSSADDSDKPYQRGKLAVEREARQRQNPLVRKGPVDPPQSRESTEEPEG